MKQILFAVLVVTVVLVLPPVVPPVRASGPGVDAPLSGCWPGNWWDELGIPETTAIPRL